MLDMMGSVGIEYKEFVCVRRTKIKDYTTRKQKYEHNRRFSFGRRETVKFGLDPRNRKDGMQRSNIFV